MTSAGSATSIPGDAPTAVLDRLALVLDAFEGTGSMSLAEVVLKTGLPRSSAHRMLDRLVQMNWLHRQGREYSLGIRLVELGSLAVHQDLVHTAAREAIQQLYRATGMVVHLAVLDGQDVVILDKLGGRLGPLVPTRVGGRLPASTSALGNSLLAYRGRNTPGDEMIRQRRFAVQRDGVITGLGCIASPIGPVGEATAAISICGPLRELTPETRMATPVQLAAAAIWRNLSPSTDVHPVLQRKNLLRALPTAARVRSEH